MKMKDKYNKTENEPLIPWEIQYMLMNDKVWSTYKGNETKRRITRERNMKTNITIRIKRT